MPEQPHGPALRLLDARFPAVPWGSPPAPWPPAGLSQTSEPQMDHIEDIHKWKWLSPRPLICPAGPGSSWGSRFHFLLMGSAVKCYSPTTPLGRNTLQSECVQVGGSWQTSLQEDTMAPGTFWGSVRRQRGEGIWTWLRQGSDFPYGLCLEAFGTFKTKRMSYRKIDSLEDAQTPSYARAWAL